MHDAEFLEALHRSALDVLARECPADRVQKHIDGQACLDEALWQTIAQLGWPMLAVAESQGGMANGSAALALVQEALGSHCAPLPFTGTALLATALAGWPDQALAGQVAAAIAEGTIRGAVGDLFGRPGLRARPAGTNHALSGQATLLDSGGWTIATVVVDGSPDPALVLLEPSDLALDRRPVADRTRAVTTLRLDDLEIPSGRLLNGEAGAALLCRLRTLALLLVAADALGGATALLDLTVEYLKTRSQFGKPIGSLQALKHRIADCRTQLEMARSLVGRARNCEEGQPEALQWAAMAKHSACEAYHHIAREAVQMHGGIGYTWEHQVHVYLKRATLDRALWGGPEGVQDLIGQCLLEQVA